MKNRDAVEDLRLPARELLQILPRFSPGYEGSINMFHRDEEKDDIQSAYVYFNFFHENVNSHNLETANHIADVIFVHHSAMKTTHF